MSLLLSLLAVFITSRFDLYNSLNIHFLKTYCFYCCFLLRTLSEKKTNNKSNKLQGIK